MASTEAITTKEGNLIVYLNVSHSVGNAAANYWTDIMLVQYFIRAIYLINGNTSSIWKLSPTSQRELGDLPDPHKDFKALSKTAKWIKYFQIDGTLHNSTPMLASGRIDPVIADARGIQTMDVLNRVFQDSLGMMGFNWKTYALQDASMPPMLKNQIKGGLREMVETG